MHRIISLLICVVALVPFSIKAQGDSISFNDVSRIINVLASDSLKGRGNLQPGLLKAARFLAGEFSETGLQPFTGFQSFFIPFRPLGGKKFSNDSVRSPYNHPIDPMLGYNIVGMLPGKTKPAEFILVSSHYDHEGVFKLKRGDSILNGANDNASGTTAMLLLAKYFAARNDNERTLLFCAFSGEEMELLGSQDFVAYTEPKKIVAGINIEMIGIPQFGKKKVFITGNEFSSLPAYLRAQLEKNSLTVIDEPDLEKELFRRSDNYPFAIKGVPMHTIMASDDDDECYHQPCDEAKRLDLENMTTIIKAIAASLEDLVNGKETPSRIK